MALNLVDRVRNILFRTGQFVQKYPSPASYVGAKAPQVKQVAQSARQFVSEPLRYMYKDVYQHPKVPSTVKQFGRGAFEGAAAFLPSEKAYPMKVPEPVTFPEKAARFAGGITGFIAGPGKLYSAIEAPIAAKLGLQTAKWPWLARKAVPGMGAEMISSAIASPIRAKLRGEPLKESYKQELTAGLTGRAVFGGAGMMLPAVMSGIKIKAPDIKLPKELEPLVQEARKYKSAEEFVGGLKNKFAKELIKQEGLTGEISVAEMARSPNVKPKMDEFYLSLNKANIPTVADFYTQATKGVKPKAKIPKELEPLAEEARKYKSAEEFTQNLIFKIEDQKKEVLKKIDEVLVGKNYFRGGLIDTTKREAQSYNIKDIFYPKKQFSIPEQKTIESLLGKLKQIDKPIQDLSTFPGKAQNFYTQATLPKGKVRGGVTFEKIKGIKEVPEFASKTGVGAPDGMIVKYKNGDEAFIAGFTDGETRIIDQIAVNKQRSKIGTKALIDYAENIKKQGIKKIGIAGVTPSSIPFWKKMGFGNPKDNWWNNSIDIDRFISQNKPSVAQPPIGEAKVKIKATEPVKITQAGIPQEAIPKSIKGKVLEPQLPVEQKILKKGIEAVPSKPIIPQEDSVQKVIDALGGAKIIRGQQEKLYSLERARRTAKVAGIGAKIPGEKGYFAQLGQLKGKLPKAQFESIRKQISQTDIDNLFNKIEQSEILLPLEKISTKTGLSKLLGAEGGSVPTKGELKLLNDVFPPEFVQAVLDKRTTMQKLFELGAEALNVPRAIMATADMSAPLRQGVFLIGRPKQWIPAFKDMVKYFFSEDAYKGLAKNIQSRPTYKAMRKNRLALTDIDGTLTSREEVFMSGLAEKIPLFGKAVRASNRAYTGFLNKLRADVFDDLYKTAKSQNLISDNPKLVEDIAKFVNSATGRGSLGSFERASVVLNSTFFSPRLMASRLNLLNPLYYAGLDPFVRKEALKSLFTFTGTGLIILTLAKMNGAEVGVDPRSADFGKIKIGNTRYDIWGGFQQYIKLAAQLISGKLISSTTGKEYTLGEGYKPLTRFDILQRFFEYKEAPIVSFATMLLRNQDIFGQKPILGAEVINRFTPMVVQDMYDLYKEKGLEGVGMAIPAIFGTGVQTYGEQVPIKDVTATGKPKVSFINKPGLGEDVWAKITGKRPDIIPDDTLYPEYLKKSQQQIAIEKAKQEEQKGIKISEPEAVLKIGLPKDKEASKELYKDALSKVKSLENKLLTLPYEPRDKIDEISRGYDIEQANKELKRYKDLIKKFQKEKPEEIFEYEVETYKSGGGANVEERSKWVVEQLKKTDNKQELINKLWDTKVLTSTASGTAAYIKEKYGIDVGKYTGTQKGLGTKVKVKKLTKITFKKLTAKKVAFKALGKKALPALKLKAAPKFKVKEPKTIKLKMPDKVLPAIKTPSANAFRLTVSR